MDIKKELEINGHQFAVTAESLEGRVLLEIASKATEGRYGEICYLLSQAYTYGVIQGKRAERRRKNPSCNP